MQCVGFFRAKLFLCARRMPVARRVPLAYLPVREHLEDACWWYMTAWRSGETVPPFISMWRDFSIALYYAKFIFLWRFAVVRLVF